MTSSVAAITDSPITGHVYTETDWNTESSLDRNAYYYSEVLAEKFVWEFEEKENPKFGIVVVNPFLVIGPKLNPAEELNESNDIFRRIFAREFPAIVSLNWGMVDVRDVAIMHVLAMEKAEAEGSFITYCATQSMRDIVKRLEEWYRERRFPSLGLDSAVGDFFVKFFAFLEKRGAAGYIKTTLGRLPTLDNSKSRKIGMEYPDIWVSVKDLSDWLRKCQLPKTEPYPT